LPALKKMEVCAMVSLLWQFYDCLNLFAAFREYKHCINNQRVNNFMCNRFKPYDSASY
jgi:hypothetical protein